MTQHSAYVWHALHCRWQCTHSITPNHSIYDVTSISGMTTQPLYQTLHPLYLCHHTITTDISPILYDITPTFWVTLYELYITSHPILMSSHHCTYDTTASIYEIPSSMRATYALNLLYHSHYLCHHTHCIDIITSTLYDITLAICVGSFALYKTSYPHCFTSNHHFDDITPTILDIVSTVSVSSQQLYWYHSHYLYDITSSICETFCPLYLWHHTHYVWHHNPLCWLHHTRHMYDIICTTEDVTSTLSLQATIAMTSHPLRDDITHPVSDIAPNVSLSSQTLHWYHTHFFMRSYPLYVWHHMHYI